MEAIDTTARTGTVGQDEDRDRRNHVHAMWAAVAPSWRDYAEDADARGAAIAERMLELTAPQPGERVLELACGPGGLGLAAAPLVGPTGEVVVSDVVAEMTEIAADRARAIGLANVRARVIDLEEITEPDGSFDVVVCREGLMFATDPARAVIEMGRVLRPGGRFAIAVWGPRGDNPWLAVVLDAVSEQLGTPVPPPGMPGPFSLGDRAALERLLVGAGLAGAVVRELTTPLGAASFDEWWTRTAALAGPVSKLLASLPDEALGALLARLREAVEPFREPVGYTFPGVSLVASGHRS